MPHDASTFSELAQMAAKEVIDRGPTSTTDDDSSGFRHYLSEKLNSWKTKSLNIGIVGNTGAGKSSTINSLLGLRAAELGAAAVGVVQTTTGATAYSHPQNPNLRLWDLPGVGTEEFPRKTYLQQIELDNFDFFLILGAGRFREEDAWLAREIAQRGKRFFYVRAKVDADVANNQIDNNMSRDETVVQVLSDLTTNLDRLEMQAAEVYLISNRKQLEYDLPRLMSDLVNSFPEIKRDALVFSLHVNGNKLLEQKVEQLLDRVVWISIGGSLLSPTEASVSATTLPDNALEDEMELYYSQLGLPDNDLEELAKSCCLEFMDLRQIADEVYSPELLTPVGMVEEMDRVVSGEPIEMPEILTCLFPEEGTRLEISRIGTFLIQTLNQMAAAAAAVLTVAKNSSDLQLNEE